MIAGVDYSTKAIDIVFHSPEEWDHVKIEMVNNLDHAELSIIYAELEANAHQTKALYLERPWSRYNAHTAMVLMRVATSIEVIARQLGIKVCWVTPNAWRSRVFGKGKYPTGIAKELSKRWATEHTGLVIKDDNTADACCIAYCGGLIEGGL